MGTNKQRLSLIIALALAIGGGLFLYYSGFFAACTSLDALRAYIDGSAPYSQLVFFLVQFLSVVLAPIPSNLSAAAGGMLFGTWPAFSLTFVAVMGGSLLVFWLARTLGQSFSDRFVSRRLSAKYQDAIRSKTSIFLVLAFLLPYFPDDILCFLAGLTNLSFRRFAVITLLTRPWGLLFASALGGASFSLPLWGLILIGLCGAALFALGLKYGDRLEKVILNRLSKHWDS
ncbi:MAG: TVP38/TMEM64 family protein [Lawsonibacter sp.]|nr:TVP38/TMEM64 family protein [Lawsonibacter sp.]